MLNKGNACLFNSSVQNFLFMIHSMKFKPQQLSMSSCILLSRSYMEGGSKKCQFTWFISLDTCCLRSLIIALSLLWVTSVPKKSKPCDGRLWPWPHRGSSMDSLSDFSPYFIPLFSFLSIFSFFFFFLYPSHIFLPDCCFPSLLFSNLSLFKLPLESVQTETFSSSLEGETSRLPSYGQACVSDPVSYENKDNLFSNFCSSGWCC